MHSKIIQPSKHGRRAYDNKGSSAALVKYLGHEAKEGKTGYLFFNATREDISPKEAQSLIDRNVKGLRKEEVKFYSLVLSPSQSELAHLAKPTYSDIQSSSSNWVNRPNASINNPSITNEKYTIEAYKDEQYKENLKYFTKKVMENYATNFSLKDGKKVGEKDLLWVALIHDTRQYKGFHQKVREGKAARGTLKEGLNTHIHVLVSKRDESQRMRLNPQGSKDRFTITKWQKQNEQSFDRIFSYDRTLSQIKPSSTEISTDKEKKQHFTGEQREKLCGKISTKLSLINNLLEKPYRLEEKEVQKIAAKKDYSPSFFYNLNRLEKKLSSGQPLNDPLHLLEHNRDRKKEPLEKTGISEQVKKVVGALSEEKLELGEDLAFPEIKARLRRVNQGMSNQQAHSRKKSGQSM